MRFKRIVFKILVLLSLLLFSCELSTNIVEQNTQTYSNTFSLEKSMKGKLFNIDKITLYRETYTMQDVEQIAYSLARTLKDKDIRKIFKQLQDNSKNSEKILEASTLLKFMIYDNKTMKTKSFLDLMKENIDQRHRNNFIDKMGNLDFGLFDIYFPFLNHLKSWEADQELYVAVVNSCIAKGNAPILAFNLDGKEIYLNPKKEPSIPTLVVCPSEKYGRYETNRAIEDPPPPPTYRYKTTLKLIYVEKQYDGGFCGPEMEIIVKYKFHNDATGTNGKWYIIGTYDVLPDKSLEVDDIFIDKNYSGYKFELKVDEDDDWLCGNDDQVANGVWDDLYNINVYQPHYTYVDDNVKKIDFLTPRYQRVRNLAPQDDVELQFKMSSYLSN